MNENPFISIIIPCYQEEKTISKCLESIIKNDYPKDRLEILVLDGKSTDSTLEKIKEYEKNHNYIRIIENSKKYQTFALNQGIRESKGSIIIRCDAHAEYSKNYIKKLSEWLKNEKIGNVGGVWINKPINNQLKTKGIAYTLSHFFCIGPNKYRTGSKNPVFTDTVPFGAWRKEIINKIGFFNEKFLKAQDLEFNIRIKRAGYEILLDPDIKIYYYPRDNFSKLFKMAFQYGYWKNLVNKEQKIISSFRQLIPPLFILYILFLPFLSVISFLFTLPLLSYLFLSVFFGLMISIEKKEIKVFPFCILTFITSHVGYGIGYLKGFLDIFLIRGDFDKKYVKITR